MEEKAYYRYIEDHSQRPGYLGESEVDMTTLEWAMLGVQEEHKREEEDRGTRCRSQEAQRYKDSG